MVQGMSRWSLALLIVLVPMVVTAQARPTREAPTLVVTGSVLEVQPDAPHCGYLAIAGWIRVRVEAVHRPASGPRPRELRLMVQCPASFSVGARHRFDLLTRRPTGEYWGMFQVWPAATSPAPTHWVLRLRPSSLGPANTGRPEPRDAP